MQTFSGLWYLDLLTTTARKLVVRDHALLTLHPDGSVSSNNSRAFSFPDLDQNEESIFRTLIIGQQSGTWKVVDEKESKIQIDFYYFLYDPLVIARKRSGKKKKKDCSDKMQYRAYFPGRWVAHIVFLARLEPGIVPRLLGEVQSTNFYPINLFPPIDSKTESEKDRDALPTFPSVPNWLGMPVSWTFRGTIISPLPPSSPSPVTLVAPPLPQVAQQAKLKQVRQEKVTPCI